MGEITIPGTPAEFLKKYDINFDRRWSQSGFAEWRRDVWDPEPMEMRPATPVEIAEEALETAARNCRVEELLDPIRALVDAKVMEVLERLQSGGAA